MDWAFFFSKWLRFLWNFQRKKVIVRISGKNFLEKTSEISVTFENLDKMSDFFQVFFAHILNIEKIFDKILTKC